MAAICSLQKAIACICFAQLFLLGTVLPQAEAQIDCPPDLLAGMFACAGSVNGAPPTADCCKAAIAGNNANCFCLKKTFDQFGAFGITNSSIAALAAACNVAQSAVKLYGSPACPTDNAPAASPSQSSTYGSLPPTTAKPAPAPALPGAAPTVLVRSLLQVTIGFATLFTLGLF